MKWTSLTRMAARPEAPRAFHIMLKPHGPACNLACAYCFYLSKERLYPNSRLRMSHDLLDTFTEQYIEAQRVPQVTFGWQGGEPLLVGLDFFRQAVELQERYRRPGMQILNTVQTNGTLLDDEWCRFFREKGFLIGLSLDGPREMHDGYRVDRRGQPTFDRVMAGLRLLQKHGVEYNILACVHRLNGGLPLTVYRFLRDEADASFIQFIPIVERDNDTGFLEGERVTDRSVAPSQYGEFLIEVFDEWVTRDVGRVSVQIFEAVLAACLDGHAGLCVFEGTCGLALAMEHNGDVYACDHFVEPRYKLGNILETPLDKLASSRRQWRFGLAKREALPGRCRRCPALFVCNGGCPKNRFVHADDGEPGLNYLCESYSAFFSHADRPMRMMASALRLGKPATTVMDIMVEEKA